MGKELTRVRYGLRSKVAPGIELHEIVIKLDEYGPPVIEMRGRIATGNRHIDRASSAVIATNAIGPAAKAFIEELKIDFGGAARPGAALSETEEA